jgi:hypothetical protein
VHVIVEASDSRDLRAMSRKRFSAYSDGVLPDPISSLSGVKVDRVGGIVVGNDG